MRGARAGGIKPVGAREALWPAGLLFGHISRADDLATEVELLRRNHAFLTILDRFREDTESIPPGEAEKQLR